jgi:hypothetical protein
METLHQLTQFVLPFVWIYFFVALGMRTLRILRRPYKADRSTARGDPNYGAFYALTFAMLPWKKESTRLHWITYMAGVLMHLAVFAALGFAISRWLGSGIEFMGLVVKFVGIAGLVAAFGLFVKRMMVPKMRTISNGDDFLSNLLVDFYLLGGVLVAFNESWEGVWRLATILLLLWIPIGKIYHMVLFFVSRLLFGWQFGRRGVIRHAKPFTY